VREQDRTTEIELTVENEGILLPVGASADVEIVTDKREGVITVTSRALFGRGGERYAFVLDGNLARRRPVAVGIFNYTTTEIMSGLSEGEIVLLPSDKLDLKDGLKVKSRE
jgi:multidrug efflux pump subunit AcrA (membrane-fusion protein)